MENEYYKEITKEDYINQYSESIKINFTVVEYRYIVKHLNIPITLENSSGGFIFVRIETGGWILVMPDEWYIYMCRNNNNRLARFYLCDQFDGLIKCLEDNHGK